MLVSKCSSMTKLMSKGGWIRASRIAESDATETGNFFKSPRTGSEIASLGRPEC